MKFPSPVSVQFIASLINAEIIGNAEGMAMGINEIHKVEKGDLVFVDHPKYYNKCIQSDADFIIINSKTEVPAGKALLVCAEPFEAYLKIVRHFRPFTPSSVMIADSATIDPTAIIMPGVFIGNNVKIGAGTIIHPNVTIYDYVEIGSEVVVHSGTVIGSDAFYFNTQKNREVWYKKMQSCGRVLIHDHVEIGASCTIDRGVTHDTIIGSGTKLDNQVHIGHDTVVGKNCLFAAQVAIAGAVDIKDGVILWGQVGVSKTLSIGENTVVLAQSGVPSSLPDNKIYFGTPVEEAAHKRRELVWVKRIPELWDRLSKLEISLGKQK
jgi:UDP-3-O-[3-hydroxymyristoyl] glucosamine N-acyltransferase